MRSQSICPACDSADLDTIHSMTLEDVYDKDEVSLQRRNTYKRNYILFEHILKRSQKSVSVSFKVCRHCGLIFFSPRPDDADLAVKYGLIASNHETTDRERAFKLVDQRERRARAIRQRLAPHISKVAGRVLDVGGADGHCMAGFTDAYDCCVLDFESRDLWPGCRRIGNTPADLAGEDRFDLAITCHTLEHIDRVSDFLQSIRERLCPDGILYIEVPYGCHDEVYRTHNILTHLNFFSTGSLGSLLERNGFVVEQCEAGPIPSSKRYVPVAHAIARRREQSKQDQRYEPRGYQITQREMAVSINSRVTRANAALDLSPPIDYGIAAMRQALQRAA